MLGPQCSLTPEKDSLELDKRTTLQVEIMWEISLNFWRSGQDDWPTRKSTVVAIQDFAITTWIIIEKSQFGQQPDFYSKKQPQMSRKIWKWEEILPRQITFEIVVILRDGIWVLESWVPSWREGWNGENSEKTPPQKTSHIGGTSEKLRSSLQKSIFSK